MKIRLNNQEIETNASTIACLMEELALPRQGVAVAVDNTLIPRAEWESYTLSEDIRIMIIKAVSGG